MKKKIILIMLSLFFATTFAENAPDTTNFNVFHGRAYYNAARTPGEAPSTHRNLYTPYLMYGSNFVAFAPSNTYGIASYTSNDQTSFIAYLSSQAIIGIATKNLGFSVAFSVGEKLNFFEEKSRYHKKEIDEIVGSYKNSISLRLAMPFQSIDLSAYLHYDQTSNDSIAKVKYADSEGKSEKEYNGHAHYISGSLTFSNKPSAKNFSWSTGGSVARNQRTSDSTYKSTIDPDENYKNEFAGNQNYFYASLFYNFGYIVLKSNNARLHVGNNTSLSSSVYDKVKDKRNHHKDFYLNGTLSLTPHILAEYTLNENWMFWGATYLNWSTSGYYEKYVEMWKTADETRNTLLQFRTFTDKPTYLSTGARFSYKRMILEAGIEAGLYENPFRGFDGKSMVYDLSGIITF